MFGNSLKIDNLYVFENALMALNFNEKQIFDSLSL